MKKLPSKTFENIEHKEIKSLSKENKDILGLKNFIKDNVYEILEESGKNNLDKNDFELIRGNIDNLLSYQKILKNKFPDKNFSISIVEKLIFGQTEKEFEKMIE